MRGYKALEMEDSDCLRLDDRLGVSLDVEEILDYWRFDPVSSPGGSNREAGDPETVLVNKTTTAVMGDVPVFPVASQIDFSNGGCEPRYLQRKPTGTKCSAFTTLHSISKEQQHSKSIKKIEFDFSQCKSENKSECTAMKVEDPFWAFYSQFQSDMRQVKTNIQLKKECFPNTSVGVKAVKVDSEIKVEDPIWACYFAKQEKGVRNVEEPVGFQIVGTKSRSSSGPGLSTSKENAFQPTLTERCDQDRKDYPMTPAEVLKTLQQSGKNSTVNRYVKQEAVDVKNEDPVWANYHMHEGRKDLNQKYEHLTLLLSSPIETHQPVTSEEMLSLIGIRQPICKVAMPSSKVEHEQTMTSDPAGPSQAISHQSSKKQRLEREPGGHSGLSSQSNISEPSVPMLDTCKRHPTATSNINKKNPADTVAYFYKCPLCDMSSISHQQDEGKLPAEAVKGTMKDKDKPWKCCVCKATYATHARLRYHRVKHISGIKCPECGERFVSENILRLHLPTHSKEKPFSCKECGKSYRLPGQFNEHMNSRHSSKRDIFCPECGKCFRVKSFLDFHMNMHTGNRPYQCTDCKASFKTPSALMAHKTIHTGKKPYSCPQCGMCFRLKDFLNKHLSTHSAGKGTVKKSGKSQTKRKKEQSDTEEDSNSMSDPDYSTDSTPQIPTSRQTRSQRKLKQVEN